MFHKREDSEDEDASQTPVAAPATGAAAQATTAGQQAADEAGAQPASPANTATAAAGCGRPPSFLLAGVEAMTAPETVEGMTRTDIVAISAGAESANEAPAEAAPPAIGVGAEAADAAEAPIVECAWTAAVAVDTAPGAGTPALVVEAAGDAVGPARPVGEAVAERNGGSEPSETRKQGLAVEEQEERIAAYLSLADVVNEKAVHEKPVEAVKAAKEQAGALEEADTPSKRMNEADVVETKHSPPAEDADATKHQPTKTRRTVTRSVRGQERTPTSRRIPAANAGYNNFDETPADDKGRGQRAGAPAHEEHGHDEEHSGHGAPSVGEISQVHLNDGACVDELDHPDPDLAPVHIQLSADVEEDEDLARLQASATAAQMGFAAHASRMSM